MRVDWGIVTDAVEGSHVADKNDPSPSAGCARGADVLRAAPAALRSCLRWMRPLHEDLLRSHQPADVVLSIELEAPSWICMHLHASRAKAPGLLDLREAWGAQIQQPGEASIRLPAIGMIGDSSTLYELDAEVFACWLSDHPGATEVEFSAGDDLRIAASWRPDTGRNKHRRYAVRSPKWVETAPAGPLLLPALVGPASMPAKPRCVVVARGPRSVFTQALAASVTQDWKPGRPKRHRFGSRPASAASRKKARVRRRMVTLRAETGNLILVGERGLARTLAEVTVTLTHPAISSDGWSSGVRVEADRLEHVIDRGSPSHSVSIIATHFVDRANFPGAILLITDVTRACIPVVPANDYAMRPERPRPLGGARQDARQSSIVGTSKLREALSSLRMQARAACKNATLSIGRVVRWEFSPGGTDAPRASSRPAPGHDAGLLVLRTRLHDKKSPKRTRRRKIQEMSVRVDAEISGDWPTMTTGWSALDDVLRQVRTSSIRVELDEASSRVRVSAHGEWPRSVLITAYEATIPLVRRELPGKLRQLNVRREASVADVRELIALRDKGLLDEHDEARTREEEEKAERRRVKELEQQAIRQRLEEVVRRSRIDI